MVALNQAKIITALEGIPAQPADEFIYDFLLAYGTAKATSNHLKIKDVQSRISIRV